MKRHDPFFVHPDVRDGLVGEWECGENLVSPVIDLSGNGNNGVIAGAVRVDGLGGHKVLNFDGIDDKVEASISDMYNDYNTISILLYPRAGENIYFFSYADSAGKYYTLKYYTGLEKIGLRANNGVISFGKILENKIPINKWTLITIVKGISSATSKIYINGNLESSVNQSLGGSKVNGILTIGGVVGISFLDCLISNVRVYNKELSAEEIKALYIFFHKKYGLKPDYLADQ